MRAAALAFATALLLAGCSSSRSDLHEGGVDGGVETIQVGTEDGGAVECAVYDGVRAGGIDCDWAGAAE